MKLDDAYYHLLLLKSGLDDSYDKWLDGYLEAEDPLSEIVLNLALCGSKVNETISCLNAYCGWKPTVDERGICDRLRNYLKDAYHSGRMSQREVVNAMYRIASAHGDPDDYYFDIWGDFYYLEDSLHLVECGIISEEVFQEAFLLFLNDGIPLDGTIWERKPPRKGRFCNFLNSVMHVMNRK